MQDFDKAVPTTSPEGPAEAPWQTAALGAAGPGALAGNRLLQHMPVDAFARVLQAGRRIKLAAGQTLCASGQAADAMVFPTSGLVAGLAVDADGAGAQVEYTGREGVVGLVEGLCGAPYPFEQRVMVSFEGWQVGSDVVRDIARACPATAALLQRHIARLYEDARRASACAARHPLRARLADCLLSYREKTGLDRLPVTQETLSAVLGANRTTVTALAIALSDAGITRTGRGWITIIHHERLNRLACGCRRSNPHTVIANAPPTLA